MEPVEGLSENDPSSFSVPEECKIVNMHLNLFLDFNSHVLKGFVDLTVEKATIIADKLVLDIRDISIGKVHDKETDQDLLFEIDKSSSSIGQKLTVNLPFDTAETTTIRIEYETSPTASALQWLKPEQTAGKQYPYLFSQCQAIHARSIIPCQDTPSVKMPYTAVLTVPSDLVALMSAVSDGEEECSDPSLKSYKFRQTVPVPSYLIALVVGALESREIGPRSKVWSEKEIIDAAASEFADTEQMLATAESLVGPYEWGVYDLIVLPPSFPFGGMENPCLTFVTPTLLAGDKSLADVVAHEISHSWTGNLVTNKTFEHFWLNEGFTVFLERKIAGRMHGESFRHFQVFGGWKELQFAIDTRGRDNPLTNLVPDLRGVDPDDAFSTVPYEKGHAMLFYLEQLLGGPSVFEPYFKAHIEKFKYQSIDTNMWKDYLYEYFDDKNDILDEVEWENWFYKPGMPPTVLNLDTSLADACSDLCQRWVKASQNDFSSFSPDDIAKFSSQQVIEFLAQLLEEKPLPVEKLKKLSELYGIEALPNSEIRFRWLRLGLQAHWHYVVPLAVKFVIEQGRMKFTRPLYRALYVWDETKAIAIDTYQKHKHEMMYVSAYTIGKDLQLI